MNEEVIKFTIERLQAIEDDEKLRERFNLGFWSNRLDTHPLDTPEDPGCGFSGCYMGWAVHQQWYAKWGLVMGFANLNQNSTDRSNIVPKVTPQSSFEWRSYFFGSSFTDNAICAVSELLGLEDETFRQVIYEEAYQELPSPGDVAQRLQEILELGEEAFGDMHSKRLEEWEKERAEADA